MFKVLGPVLLTTLFGCGPQSVENQSADFEDPSGFALSASPYLIGTGIADVTGPASDVQMMGYVKPGQRTAGIHLRQRSRAFIIANEDGHDRVVFVQTDIMAQYLDVTREVVAELKRRYGDLYSNKNLVLTATHTHSGPGNYSTYRLYNLLYQFGHNRKNFDTIVDGIVRAISRAHENLQPGSLTLSRGELLGVNRNRSVEAYELNKDADQYRFNQDIAMSQVRLNNTDGRALGIMNWFPVHATSVKSENRLISSDNKGLASLLFEQSMGTDYQRNTPFVAGFFNSNAGDSSPNIGGDLTGDGEWNCPAIDSQACVSQNAEAQLSKSRQLFDSLALPITGEIETRHRFVDFSTINVKASYTNAGDQQLCVGAIGLAKLAGTKDGRGIGEEGATCDSVGPIARSVMCTKRTQCQGVKPVVIDSERAPWTPQILPIQLVRIGQIAFVAAPAEFTTMAGRRIRNAVSDILEPIGVEHVVFAGYANAYAGYVTTQEEYQLQAYEGGGTHFGEWTEAGYRQEFSKLAQAMVDGFHVPPGEQAPSLLSEVKLMREPRNDEISSDDSFGDVLVDVKPKYSRGERASVTFVGSNLSHDTRAEGSYLEVQRLVNDKWIAVLHDWDWSTKLYWLDQGRGKSNLMVEWDIPAGIETGHYRITIAATAKTSNGLAPYKGTSAAFVVH